MSLSKMFLACLALAFLLLTWQSAVKAMEFNISGTAQAGIGLANAELMSKKSLPPGYSTHKTDDKERFGAAQNFKLKLDAVASEALSGTVYFEIDQKWGKASQGAALGADGINEIMLKNAFLDFATPNGVLRTRMGIQTIKLPHSAGGSAILGTDVASIATNIAINEHAGITALWLRPVNDNFHSGYFVNGKDKHEGWLDNMDLFMLSLPLSFDALEVTPWVMYGIMGKNSLRGLQKVNDNEPWRTSSGNLGLTIPGLDTGINFARNLTPFNSPAAALPYSSMVWLGLPINCDLLEPWHLELDINYGYVGGVGKYGVIRRGNEDDVVRGSTRREGWLVKALAEYRLDWGSPGILGWYASGDDGNVKNGSERLPSFAGAGNFTSFIGDGNLAWGAGPGNICDWNLSYAGTWGIGLQLANLSFLENFSQTARIVYWGGTNSPSMVKYMQNAVSWSNGYGGDGPYLTTNDGLLEFNLINCLQIYENLEANLELGYIVNCIDKDTWRKTDWYGGKGNGDFTKQDAWKAQLALVYTF